MCRDARRCHPFFYPETGGAGKERSEEGEESIENILEMSKLKENGNLKALVVTGCLAKRYKDEIQI